MSGLSLDLDQRVKEEQYKDLLREAEHYRLVKAVAQPGSNHLQKVVASATGKAIVRLYRRLQGLGSTESTPASIEAKAEL